MGYRPQLTVTPALLATLEAIAALREKILSATIQVAWIPALQKDARARNTHSSTAIEGNPLTLEQVRLLEEGHELPTEPARSTQEVLNYLAGLRYIERHAAVKPVTHRHVLKLHAVIMQGVMDQGAAGRYREIAVRVGRYIPPPASQVSGLMAELLAWWNGEAARWSPVISSAILHYRFEEIHPFADGNGRTGRALATWELYCRGFDTHHIFSVDEVFWENRPRYYAELDSVRRRGGDLTPWLEYCADGVHTTLDRVWARIQQFSAKKGSGKIVLRPRQEQLLRLLRDRASLSPSEIREALKLSKQGAMDVLNPLLAAGLIRRVGTKKSGRYLLA
jgi:Fic family protein